MRKANHFLIMPALDLFRNYQCYKQTRINFWLIRNYYFDFVFFAPPPQLSNVPLVSYRLITGTVELTNEQVVKIFFSHKPTVIDTVLDCIIDS